MSLVPLLSSRPLPAARTKPPFMEWEDFQAKWNGLFKQGEHVTIIGPTGSGKTLLAEELIKPRTNVVALGIKPKDESLKRLNRVAGWRKVRDWKMRKRWWQEEPKRVILWPKVSDMERVEEVQRETFRKLLSHIWRKGGWCIWTDELRYMTDIIKLRKHYIQMYITSRSNGVSLVSSAQRPSHVPLEAYSQAQHLFLFRTGDERDLVRMGGLNGNNAKQIAMMVADLPKHHFLHVNLNDGSYVQSTLKGNFS